MSHGHHDSHTEHSGHAEHEHSAQHHSDHSADDHDAHAHHGSAQHETGHDGHGEHDHGHHDHGHHGHGDHGDHVGQFRRLFWIMLVLAVPVVALNHMFADLLGYGLPDADWVRSEEHTSELQSRGHLVCRLLLEKKK